MLPHYNGGGFGDIRTLAIMLVKALFTSSEAALLLWRGLRIGCTHGYNFSHGFLFPGTSTVNCRRCSTFPFHGVQKQQFTMARTLKRKRQKVSAGAVAAAFLDDDTALTRRHNQKQSRVKSVKNRCTWLGKNPDPLYITYHDEEWGGPLHDDNKLFELMCLEGAQAGLSWITVLKKRKRFREVFAGFDIDVLSGWDGQRTVEHLITDAGIIRHRGKIGSVVSNAKIAHAVQKDYGTLDEFLWSFVPDGKPIINSPVSLSDLPSKTPESEAMSAVLKSKGFKFFGPTIAYAFMQAAGLVNDHLISCACHVKSGG